MSAKHAPFTVETFEQVIEERTPGYLIDDLLPERSIGLLLGEPKVGKTFVALRMAWCCAVGTPFLGRRVRTGPVLYVHAEGGGGVPNRVKALAQQDGFKTVFGIHFVRRPVKILDDEHFQHLLRELRAMEAPPTSIYFDTLGRSIIPADESSNTDVNRYVERAEELRNEFGCAVVILHHPGHGGRGRPRGASSLMGSVDVLLRLEANGAEGLLDLHCDFMKDGSPFEPIAMRRTPVHLGIDDSGRPQSSCVIEESDHTPTGGESPRSKIIGELRTGGPMLATDLAEATGMNPSTLRNHLSAMQQDGVLEASGSPKRFRLRKSS